MHIRVALWASHVKITFIFKIFQDLKTTQNRKILPLTRVNFFVKRVKIASKTPVFGPFLRSFLGAPDQKVIHSKGMCFRELYLGNKNPKTGPKQKYRKYN